VHCGEVGAGQIAKICNNLILGISMAAVAEGMALGAKLGIDPKKSLILLICLENSVSFHTVAPEESLAKLAK